jgi:hypothetical protein
MSIHEEINQAIRGVIADNAHADIAISPTFIARQVVASMVGNCVNVYDEYMCTEHAKQMSRRVLAARFNPDGEENETHQNDMFSGELQERYPIPRASGDDPQYKPRHMLSASAPPSRWQCFGCAPGPARHRPKPAPFIPGAKVTA